MRRQYGKFGLSLALAGLVMMAFALWGAQSVVHRLQYVVLAPVLASGAQGSSEGAEGAADQQPGSDAESDSNDADDAEGANEVDAPNELTQALSALYNALSGLELHAGVCGEVNGFSIEGEGGRSEKATLHATDERWFELYPKALLYGRTIAAGEFTSGARIALLDQELAFDCLAYPIRSTARFNWATRNIGSSASCDTRAYWARETPTGRTYRSPTSAPYSFKRLRFPRPRTAVRCRCPIRVGHEDLE